MSGYIVSTERTLAKLPGLDTVPQNPNGSITLSGPPAVTASPDTKPQNNYAVLSDLAPGQTGVLSEINFDGLTRLRLWDFGFVKGTLIELVRKGPGGAILAARVRGTLVALRSRDAERIMVSPRFLTPGAKC
ncbi:MAG: FeoA family protein [Bacillota bacterium]|jgi:ferrous iron transport protein A